MASRYYRALFNAVGGKAENDFWTRGELITEAELGSDQQVERLLKMGAIEPCEPPATGEILQSDEPPAAPAKPRQPRRARPATVAEPEPAAAPAAEAVPEPVPDSLELMTPAAEVPDLPDLEAAG